MSINSRNKYREKEYRCIYEDNDFLILWKAPALHSAPLKTGDKSLFTFATQVWPEILEVKGKKAVEGGLIHRLDFESRGLLLIARNNKTYENFIRLQAEGNFLKEYRVLVVDRRGQKKRLLGFPPLADFNFPSTLREPFYISSAFRYWGRGRKAVRPLLIDAENTPHYSTKIISIESFSPEIKMEKKEDLKLVRVRLRRGFRHQIRSHLAWHGLPLAGDILYGGNLGNPEIFLSAFGAPFFLEATALAFPFLRSGLGDFLRVRYEECLSSLFLSEARVSKTEAAR